MTAALQHTAKHQDWWRTNWRQTSQWSAVTDINDKITDKLPEDRGIRCSVAAVSNLADLWYLSRSLTTTSWAYRSSSSSVCSSSCPVRWPTNFERFSVTTAEMRHTRSIAYRCSDTLNHGTGRRTMSHRVACLLMLNIWNSYYAALLPRRGPNIASHSVCPSVRPSRYRCHR